MIDRDENLIDSCVHLAGRTDQTLWITESMSTLEMFVCVSDERRHKRALP